MRGLVLEGGGTKGAYQIGAYKALKKLGMDFQGISGTSIGALNGAYIIQNNIEVMEDIWLTYDYTHFMNIDEETYEKFKNIDFTPKNFNQVLELMNKARKNEGIDISPLKKLLEDTLDESIIRKSTKDFGLVTVTWERKFNPHPMYIENIPEGKLVNYLIASASLPIFKLETLDDKLFLDGMFFDNVPVCLLNDKGYKDIVVVRLMDDIIGRRNLSRYNDLNIKTIIPSDHLGGALNKDKDNVQRNIDLGYLDTMKAYNRYEGNRYFFNVDLKYSDDYCFEKLKNLSSETIEALCSTLGIKREISLRTLMENVIPKLGDMLGLSKEFTYKELFYSIYEKKMEDSSISRVQLYDINKVVDVVNKNIYNSKDIAIKLESKPIISFNKNKTVKCLTNTILKDIIRQG